MAGRIIEFPESGSWRLTTLIHASCHHYDVEEGFAESVAVFECQSVNSANAKEEQAIAKVWLQHDPCYVQLDDRDYADCDFSAWSMAQSEYQWLRLLQDRGCRSVPQWCEAVLTTQDDDMPYPGGYQLSLVEQKLPGRSLTDFFEIYDEEQREVVRQSFRAAFDDMGQTRILQLDRAARNVLWDEQSQKWYVDASATK
ncbi:MAG: hypothetical protein Q9162_005585 [Coniocarpon cinnabarinum]